MGRLAAQPWTTESDRRYTQHAIKKAAPPIRLALLSFAKWLETDRGLTIGSIVVRIQAVRWFVAAMCKRKRATPSVAFARVTSRDVEDFFVAYARKSGPVARRSMQAAMRLFLKYAAARRWCSAALPGSVPSLRRYRLLHVPRAISEQELERLLRSVAAGARAKHRAIVFLLAVYGVRRGQIARLRVDDIDWTARTILFRGHKRGKPILHLLEPAVADALAVYLRVERPASNDMHVFLGDRVSHSRLSPASIYRVVRACMVTAGLPPRSANSLRHGFASRLLRAGQSLKTIADLLGHRSFDTVAVYAKVDQPRLLEVAVEWPGAS
jgi:integrase